MFQRVEIIGNLGRDPEMRYTPSGIAVTNISVATSKKWKNQSGQMQEETVWFRVTLWRNDAENANQYLKKGSRVFVAGEIKEPKIWFDKEGTPRTSLEMTSQFIKYLSKAPDEGSSASDAPFTVEEPEGV